MARSATWFVYILECANGRLYTGITVDLERRFKAHASGRGGLFTRRNRPYRLLAAKRCADRSAASRLEAEIKRWPRAKKRDWAARAQVALPDPP